MKYNKWLATVACLGMLAGCGGNSDHASNGGGGGESLPPVGVPQADDSIIRGRAEVQVGMANDTALFKLFDMFIMRAYAATGATTVTYTNAASVSFTINVAAFAATVFTGTTLNLGHVDLATLDDNNLKICGAGNNVKCTQAIIRVYTTGSVAGFVQQTDLYGAPVYAGSLNPASAVGLNTAGSVQVQTVTIASNKNRLRVSDFTTPNYTVTSDFSNAGSGNYSMNFVVEYLLAP